MSLWIDADELRTLRTELASDVPSAIRARTMLHIRFARALLLTMSAGLFTLTMALAFYWSSLSSHRDAPGLLLAGYVLGTLPVVLAAWASCAIERAVLARLLRPRDLGAAGGVESTVAIGAGTRR